MKTTQIKFNIKAISIICACLLFVAVLNLPIEYYLVLRVVVCIGALLVSIVQKHKHVSWVIIFLSVAVLFNPIIPLYLYVKAYWIPIDIITGILFLLVSIKGKPKSDIKKPQIKKQKEFRRDKIY